MRPEDIRIGAAVTASMAEMMSAPERWEEFADGKLRDMLIRKIITEKAKMVRTEYMVEKRIDLYVAEPEVFWQAVHDEAERIAMRYK